MASTLVYSQYILKVFLFQHQYDTARENIKQVEILADYIALLHMPYFLKCPLVIRAPHNDRDFCNDLHAYKECFNRDQTQFKTIEAFQESFNNHLWYLTQELVVFGLFDDGLPPDEGKAMTSRLLDYPRPAAFEPGKPIFPVELMIGIPSLDPFVGSKSWLLFEKLQANGNWLGRDVNEWETDIEYQRIRKFLMDLKVVNDLAERCVKDIQEYADVAQDSQYREDILLVPTDHRGVLQDLRKELFVERFNEKFICNILKQQESSSSSSSKWRKVITSRCHQWNTSRNCIRTPTVCGIHQRSS